jgi:hypothetical protein
MTTWRSTTIAAVVLLLTGRGFADDAVPKVTGVDPQPLKAQATRIVQTLDLLGSPLTPDAKKTKPPRSKRFKPCSIPSACAPSRSIPKAA